MEFVSRIKEEARIPNADLNNQQILWMTDTLRKIYSQKRSGPGEFNYTQIKLFS